jgi:hypothetical protein
LLDLGGNVNEVRATLLIELATELCTSVVTPIPDNARAIVMTVAARAYTNASGVLAQTVGPATVQYGASSGGGLYLTKWDIAALKRCAGIGGAFTINPVSVDAATGLYTWDQNVWLLGRMADSLMPELEPDGAMWSE